MPKWDVVFRANLDTRSTPKSCIANSEFSGTVKRLSRPYRGNLPWPHEYQVCWKSSHRRP
jgi:hypothetical protein